MVDNKYYTPTIEEFHVGFEFEVNYTDEGWTKEVFCSGEGRNIDSVSKLKAFLGRAKFKEAYRVKHLDREDIESLGFVFKGGDTHLTYHYGGYAITHTPSNNKINIYYYDGSEFVNAITIKNKSELKRLLKQLNIIT